MVVPLETKLNNIGRLVNKISAPRDPAIEFIPSEHFGGNFDDAYNGGIQEGYAQLALDIREILNEGSGTA